MHVSIRNLGPVREADLDLSKRLVILTGPNNSGKTYLTWSLYGFLRAVARGAAVPDCAREFAGRLLKAPNSEAQPGETAEFQRTVVAARASAFGSALGKFFAVSDNLFANTTITARLADDHAALAGTVRLELLGDGGYAATFSPRTTGGLRTVCSYAPTSEQSFLLEDKEEIAAVGQTALTPEQFADAEQSLATFLCMILPSAPASVFLFPAERIAVNVFAKELALKRTGLVDKLLDGAPSATLREAGRYPVPIRDSIRQANDLARASKRTSRLSWLASELEAILGGSIGLSEDGELAFVPAEQRERTLAFHITSSLVKSLASLAFYFRHLAHPDGWILIDEPELNLHPDLQRKVARFLAKAVGQGIRLIISTHSDYLIRELSNLVRLGERGVEGERIADKLGYDKGSLLRAADVGAWLLQDGKANALPVDADGFTVPTIDDAIEAQNRDTQAISFGLPE